MHTQKRWENIFLLIHCVQTTENICMTTLDTLLGNWVHFPSSFQVAHRQYSNLCTTWLCTCTREEISKLRTAYFCAVLWTTLSAGNMPSASKLLSCLSVLEKMFQHQWGKPPWTPHKYYGIIKVECSDNISQLSVVLYKVAEFIIWLLPHDMFL